MGKTGLEQIGSQESTGSRRHRHHIGHAGRWSGPLVPESIATRSQERCLLHRLSSTRHRRSWVAGNRFNLDLRSTRTFHCKQNNSRSPRMRAIKKSWNLRKHVRPNTSWCITPTRTTLAPLSLRRFHNKATSFTNPKTGNRTSSNERLRRTVYNVQMDVHRGPGLTIP